MSNNQGENLGFFGIYWVYLAFFKLQYFIPNFGPQTSLRMILLGFDF